MNFETNKGFAMDFACPEPTARNMVAFITGITGQDGSYLAELLLEKGYEVHGTKRRTSSPNLERIQHLLRAGDYITLNAFHLVSEQLPSLTRIPADNRHAHKLHLHYGDVTDFGSLCGLISKIAPKEIYNLAAQSHVQVSFELPSYTADAAGQVCCPSLMVTTCALCEEFCEWYTMLKSDLVCCLEIYQQVPKAKLLYVQGVLHVLEAVRAAGLTHQTRIYQASTSELYGKVAEVPQTEQTPFYPRSPYAVSKLFGFWMVKNYR